MKYENENFYAPLQIEMNCLRTQLKTQANSLIARLPAKKLHFPT